MRAKPGVRTADITEGTVTSLLLGPTESTNESLRCQSGVSGLIPLPRCGDGVVSDVAREETLSSPVVTNPNGATGRICDDGSTCPSASCTVGANGNAPEHGICQALGFDRGLAQFAKCNSPRIPGDCIDPVTGKTDERFR